MWVRRALWFAVLLVAVYIFVGPLSPLSGMLLAGGVQKGTEVLLGLAILAVVAFFSYAWGQRRDGRDLTRDLEREGIDPRILDKP